MPEDFKTVRRPSPRLPHSPRSSLLLLLLVVSLAHWAVLYGLHLQAPPLRPLANMAEPLFTRLLQVAEPAAPPPLPVATVLPAPQAAKKTTARRVEAAVSKATSGNKDEPVAKANPDLAVAQPGSPQNTDQSPAPESANAVGTAPATAAEPAPHQATAPEPPAQAVSTAPETAQVKADPLQSWPLDTRLTYRLGGFYRGELHGNDIALVVARR